MTGWYSLKRGVNWKGFWNFTDNVFEIFVMHSRVIGPKCFINNLYGLFLVQICFRTQDCFANDNFMLYLAFFSNKKIQHDKYC